MTQYIDKDSLVVEIERKVAAYQKNFDKADNKIARLSTDGRIQGLKVILSFINTLEVKEVDLEKEIDNWYNTMGIPTTTDALKETACHFFELGLKVQKGE